MQRRVIAEADGSWGTFKTVQFLVNREGVSTKRLDSSPVSPTTANFSASTMPWQTGTTRDMSKG
jgi:hypothetical protein